MSNLDLGLIGNCSLGALIDRVGRVVWCCLPRFDGDPVFCNLLDGDSDEGLFAIEIEDFEHAEQEYIPNTAILLTRLYDRAGAGIEIADFAPRFSHAGRRFRPTTIVRRMRPDVPLPYVLEERPFLLRDPAALILGPDEALGSSVLDTAREWFERTEEYWRIWVRSLTIPFEWQDAVIRSAITLKLCSLEQTGAIVAALTTSIPEAAGTQRNWDYR